MQISLIVYYPNLLLVPLCGSQKSWCQSSEVLMGKTLKILPLVGYFRRAALVTLTEIIENNNDATLEELCELLEEQTGIEVSRATMGRISQKLDYTFKKKLSMLPKKKKKKSSIKE